MLRRLLPDRFLLVLVGTVGLASLLPASGRGLTAITWISNAAIVLLFFLHGARLSPQAVLDGARRWRLQGAILLFGYLALPLVGTLFAQILAGWWQPGLVMGIVFLAVLPTTVQSSIAYASIAGGNVAASVVAAAASNLIGVVLTPALFALLAASAMGAVSLSGVGKVAMLLLLPFATGQLLRRPVAPVIARHKAAAGYADKTTIVLAVYVAFSGAVTEGLWSRVSPGEIAAVAGIAALLLLLVLAMAGAWTLGGAMGLGRADRASFLFAASHKSLATGAPMARVLFPAATAGFVILPLMIYHQLQLMLSAVVAARLAAATPSTSVS